MIFKMFIYQQGVIISVKHMLLLKGTYCQQMCGFQSTCKLMCHDLLGNVQVSHCSFSEEPSMLCTLCTKIPFQAVSSNQHTFWHCRYQQSILKFTFQHTSGGPSQNDLQIIPQGFQCNYCKRQSKLSNFIHNYINNTKYIFL